MSEIFDNSNETSLLSILMRDTDKAYDAQEVLRREMFTSLINSTIYGAIEELARTGRTPVAEHVIAHLKSSKTIEQASGETHIKAISDEIKVDSSMFDTFLKLVVDAHKGRKLLELSSKIPMIVHNTDDMSGAINAITSDLSNIESDHMKNGVLTIDEALVSAYDLIEERREKKLPTGILTGFSTIDYYTGGYAEGQEWIISGRPGMGKTTAVLSSMKEVAKANIPCMLFNREMNPEELMFRLLSMETSIPYRNIKTGELKDYRMQQLRSAMKRLSEVPFFIDSNYYGDIHYIVSSIRKHHKLHGIRVVGIDYAQLLTDRSKDQVSELGRISRELKLLAMDLRITIILLSQLNRKTEEREDKRPMLSDLRASGNLEEDADVVIGLYRDEMYNPLNSPHAGKIDFIILKQRNGPLGNYTFDFNGKCVQIIDNLDKKFNFGREDGQE
jgi:replicative DNA helicase